jgi:hypothetical protein
MGHPEVESGVGKSLFSQFVDMKKAVIRWDGGLNCVYIKHSKVEGVDVASGRELDLSWNE